MVLGLLLLLLISHHETLYTGDLWLIKYFCSPRWLMWSSLHFDWAQSWVWFQQLKGQNPQCSQQRLTGSRVLKIRQLLLFLHLYFSDLSDVLEFKKCWLNFSKQVISVWKDHEKFGKWEVAIPWMKILLLLINKCIVKVPLGRESWQDWNRCKD